MPSHTSVERQKHRKAMSAFQHMQGRSDEDERRLNKADADRRKRNIEIEREQKERRKRSGAVSIMMSVRG